MVAAILLVVASGAAPAGEYTEVPRTPAEVKRGDECDRLLVFSLHASQRCPEAVKEIGPAIENSPELLADPQFMLSAVDCYAETGQIETGEKALNALLRNNPSMKDNAGVIQLQKFFASKKPAGPATPAAP